MVSAVKTVKIGNEHKLLFKKAEKRESFGLLGNFSDLGESKINLNIKKANCNHPGTFGQIQNLLHQILILQGSNS